MVIALERVRAAQVAVTPLKLDHVFEQASEQHREASQGHSQEICQILPNAVSTVDNENLSHEISSNAPIFMNLQAKPLQIRPVIPSRKRIPLTPLPLLHNLQQP